MNTGQHEMRIPVGRRDGDGHVLVSVFASQLLALTLEGRGERAPTLLLTVDHARRLQNALGELIRSLEEAEREKLLAEENQAPWQGVERRKSDEMNA